MKRIMTKALGLGFLSAALAIPALADQKITYKNQRGSTLTLTWHDSSEKVEEKAGTLTGIFTSAVGKCAAGMPFPVTGVFNGNAIAININLPKCKQVIAMTGNLTNGNEELHTLWLDAAQAADPRKNDWNSNIIGADSYKKQG